jgi:hypothetical protein
MLTSAISIAMDGRFTATTGQIYSIFLAIHLLQGLLCCSITRILARVQNVFIVGNLAIVIATIAALPAATPSEERNGAAYIFGHWENINGWVGPLAFILCKSRWFFSHDAQHGFRPCGLLEVSIRRFIYLRKRPTRQQLYHGLSLVPLHAQEFSDGFALLLL